MNTKLYRLLLCLLALTLCLCAGTAFAVEKATVVIDKSVTKLYEGDTLQLQLTCTGAATEGTVTFTSANKNVTVDDSGLVTGVSKGSAIVRVAVVNGKQKWNAQINLTVLRRVETVTLNAAQIASTTADDPAIATLLEGADEGAAALIDADPRTPVLFLSVGRSYTLSGTVEPKDASDRTLVFSVGDEFLLSLRGTTLKPLKPGVTTLTAATKNQEPAATTDYVALIIQPVQKLTVTAGTQTLHMGERTWATAAFTPNTASIQQVTWSSNNTMVATVDPSGNIEAVGRGSARITAKATDGSNRTADVNIRVLQQPTEITLHTHAETINVGAGLNLRVTMQPKVVDDKNLVWTSSDERIAKVNASGRVTGVSVGTCTITATSAAAADVFDECEISVQQPVTSIVFLSKTYDLNIYESGDLFWTVNPANATNPEVTFTSSNPSICTVDQNGRVYGVKRGTTTVIARSTDGSKKSASIKVNILQPVEGVHMKNDSIRVGVDESGYAQAVLEPADASNKRMTWTVDNSYYATVSGNNTRPKVTGKHWGTTVIRGTTEDGGFTTSCTIKVGNLNKALRINDLYTRNNQIRIVVQNVSNMKITNFYFNIDCYDIYDNLLPVTKQGYCNISGSYDHSLGEGDVTSHGLFTFPNYVQPHQTFGRLVMTITGYRTSAGNYHEIKPQNWQPYEFISEAWVGPTPAPTPVPTPEPPPNTSTTDLSGNSAEENA